MKRTRNAKYVIQELVSLELRAKNDDNEEEEESFVMMKWCATPEPKPESNSVCSCLYMTIEQFGEKVTFQLCILY